MEIKLGQRVKDRISGFTGIATSRHEYMNGCVRISVTPPVDKDNKPQDAQAFDIQDIEVVNEGVGPTPKPTGGPQSGKVQHR